MKKIGTLNQPLASVIAGMGHLDTLVICDAGLPIPKETNRIDLALIAGVPDFLTTLETVISELKVEKTIIAREMVETSPQLHNRLKDLLGEIPIETVSHEAFKDLTHTACAVVRTGEFTPYANIILVAGVVF